MAGSWRISLPSEHGAWITVVGAAALAVYLSPVPLAGGLAALACLLGFVARGPVERRAAGRVLEVGDWLLLAACLTGAAAALLWLPAEPVQLALVGATAAAFPLIGALARAVKAHRTLVVEAAGLAASGAVATVVLIAGGEAPVPAAIVGGALAAYGAATVIGVKGEARKAAPGARRAGLISAALATAAAGALLLLAPLAAVGFAPRILFSSLRAARPGVRRRIYRIALRETLALAGFLVLLALSMRG